MQEIFRFLVRKILIRSNNNQSNHIIIKLNHVKANVRQSAIFVNEANSIHESMKEYFKIENMGVCCALECRKCECGKLVKEHKNLSMAEEKEFNIIKKSLEYNFEREH